MQSTFALATKVFISAMLMYYLLDKFTPTLTAWTDWAVSTRAIVLFALISLATVSYAGLLWMLGTRPADLKLEVD